MSLMRVVSKQDNQDPSAAIVRGYVPTLDGWRAVAILGVVLCHGLTPISVPGGYFQNEKIAVLTSVGAYGVDFFFCISGFIITHRLLEEQLQRGTISLGGFYVRRAFRILPPSLLYLCAIFVLQRAGVLWVEPSSWVASLFFFKNVVPDRTWYLSHFWSLSVEEQFYLVWPALFILFQPRLGIVMAAALAVCGVAMRHWFSWAHYEGLLAGCLLAFVIGKGRYLEFLRRILPMPVWLVVLVAFLGGATGGLPWSQWWLSLSILLLIAGTVVNPDTPIARFLEQKPVRWLGRLSYSLYLWQQLFCLMNFSGGRLGALQTFPLNLVLSLALAVLSYKFVERPSMRLGHALAPPTTPGSLTKFPTSPADRRVQPG